MQTKQFSMLITSPFATGFYIDLNTLLTVKDGSFSNNLNSINEFAKMLNENNHLNRNGQQMMPNVSLPQWVERYL